MSNDDEAREHNRSRIQKDLRRRRGERAFLFDKDLSRCLGDVDRDDWEFAIAISGGDVALAAQQCVGFREAPTPVRGSIRWSRAARVVARRGI